MLHALFQATQKHIQKEKEKFLCSSLFLPAGGRDSMSLFDQFSFLYTLA